MGKVINDPVHGFISIENESLLSIIDSAPFQRLRRIRQMGVADYVYPGAEHTRFLHSLGAYHLIKKAFAVLRSKGVSYTEEEYLSAQVAILLHDVGHFPYSHALENSVLLDVHHESMSRAIMKQLNQEMDNRLSVAIDIFENRYPKAWIHQLISGHIDVDRMDYLVRDSFFSGVAEGMVGLDRLLQMIDVVEDQLVLEEKAIFSIDKFLIARRIMYSQVYTHKTVLGAEKLLHNILRRAQEVYHRGELQFITEDLDFFYLKKQSKQDLENPKLLQHFLRLNDAVIDLHVQHWTLEKDAVLSDLSRRLVSRQLLKCMDVENADIYTQTREEVAKRLPTISVEDLDYYCFSVDISQDFYDRKDGTIPILRKDGSLKRLEDFEFSFTHKLAESSHHRRLLYFAG